METWQIWIIVAIFLFIIEVFAPTFFALSLGVGALAAGIAAMFWPGIEIQLLFFSVFTLIAFFGARPILLKYVNYGKNKVQTNVNALVGRKVMVTEDIDPESNQGRVKLDGESWRAVTITGEKVAKDSFVEIVEVDSTLLIVKPI